MLLVSKFDDREPRNGRYIERELLSRGFRHVFPCSRSILQRHLRVCFFGDLISHMLFGREMLDCMTTARATQPQNLENFIQLVGLGNTPIWRCARDEVTSECQRRVIRLSTRRDRIVN